MHIQFALNFENPVRLAALTKVDSKCHYVKVHRDNGVDAYCMKEETRVEGPFEFGVKPVRRNVKTDWEEVKQHAING